MSRHLHVTDRLITARPPRVVVAEANEVLRDALARFLEKSYETFTAATSDELLSVLGRLGGAALVMCDTELKPVGGVACVRMARARCPLAKYALLTRRKVEALLPELRRHGLYNVLIKSTPLNFREFGLYVENLIAPQNAFGLRRYLHPPAEIHEIEIQNREDRARAMRAVTDFFGRYRPYESDVGEIRLACEELLNNAIYHAFRGPTGARKYPLGTFQSLDTGEDIIVYYGRDDSNLGCAVRDNQGTLEVDQLLARFDRQITLEGLFDESGRGLHLTWNLADQMIVNIYPGVRTEIILLFSHRSAPASRPLLVNVVEPVQVV
ncbi:MAG: ATP-binding protein [Candidatus Sumerlaeaceae bacterium]|nr:ATP-binding protein [Candidatus Sumerlaeaceae bacterium]